MPTFRMKGIHRCFVCVIVSNPSSQYNDIMKVVVLVIDIIYNQRC
jgi:hypothetical protein